MADWSNGSVLDLNETSDANPINGDSVGSGIESVKDGVECFFFDDDDDDDDDDQKGSSDVVTVKDGVECVVDDYKGRQRCTFDQVMSVFLSQISDRGVVRPVPPVFGNGQNVDLFKLFCVVRDIGGCDSVSRKRLWSFVSKEMGSDSGATAASVKLIHFKYLNELGMWFRESCERSRSLGNGESGRYGTCHLLSLEVEREFRGLLLDGTEEKVNGDGVVHLESDQNGKTEYSLSDTKDACTMHSGTETCNGDNDERVFNGDQKDSLMLTSSVGNKENDRKRKRRESLSGMLNWVNQTATQLGDVSVGEIPGPAKWKKHEGNEFWFQAIKAREALMREDINPKTEEIFQQKKLRMHPLMYEDYSAAGHCSERLRSRGRLPHSTKSRPCPCCDSLPPTQGNSSSPHILSHNNPKEQEPIEVDLASPPTSVTPSDDDESREKYVSVGPLYQADVPEWTGVSEESDSKWLGTRLWPWQCEEDISLVKPDNIGQGRPDFCDCQLPGSVTCYRFHIAEARMKLKKELGSLFYHWKFDRMGEEISLQWTAEEETRFKILVQSKYPFWNSASKWFSRKTRENLVNYYFNVFLVKRRIYQNRVTPKGIDSDDDETDFGSFCEGFGHEAVKVSGSSFLSCSQNKQCDDLV